MIHKNYTKYKKIRYMTTVYLNINKKKFESILPRNERHQCARYSAILFNAEIKVDVLIKILTRQDRLIYS